MAQLNRPPDGLAGGSIDPGVNGTAAEAGGTDFRHELATLVPELRAYARFLLRDRTAADDLVQDTIVRALASMHQFIPGSSLRGWLFTIQRNLHHEQARRRRTEQRVLAQGGMQEHSHAAPQHGMAALSELQRHMWSLPEALREALVLVGAQGLSYEEASSICGVPEGTVKARVSRARRALAVSISGSPDASVT